jgi:hypothetical protein
MWIETIKQNLCVKRVQNVFRKYLEQDVGTPLLMRPLMHPGYGSQRTKYRSRHAERPVRWLLRVISDVFRSSMRNEQVDWLLMGLSSVSSVVVPSSLAHHSMPWTSNGGIGPAPKPLLLEILYDHFLDKFGSRWEAEKLVHDVFFNTRARALSTPLVQVFAYLCCLDQHIPEDRLLGQNEALVFLHGVFRCGLHPFHIIHPPETTEHDTKTMDQILHTTAETILLTAFSKLEDEEKLQLQQRLQTQVAIYKSTSNLNESSLPADIFLLLALQEWKGYVLHRMHCLRLICTSLEVEMMQFQHTLHLDFIATVLQKAQVTFSNDDLCCVFRRMCSTQPLVLTTTQDDEGPSQAQKSISYRLAAACYPLLAKEPIMELKGVENAGLEDFKLYPVIQESARFLIETWRGYDESCRELMEELRRIGKNNDIAAEAISRTVPSNGGRVFEKGILHLSRSVASDTLSSQDVAQLDAVFHLFIEKLERLKDELKQPPKPKTGLKTRRVSIVVTEALDLDAKETLLNSGGGLLNETWKMFRQLLVGFARLRALASLGTGPLPDKWDPDTSSATTA